MKMSSKLEPRQPVATPRGGGANPPTNAQPGAATADVLRTVRRGSSPVRRAVKWFVWLGLLGGLAFGGYQGYLHFTTPTKVEFRTAKVKRGSLTMIVTATGALEPTNTIDVGCEVSGRIQDVLADFNDPVKKGQVLATLDTEQLLADVRRSEATLAASQADLKQAEATYVESRSALKRMEELHKRKGTTDAELEAAVANQARAEAASDGAKAKVSVSAAALAGDKTKLEKATIVAPITGVVLTRHVEPGQTVASMFQTPILFTLAEDLRRMELRVDVDEADVGAVRNGQKAEFTVDAYADKKFPAVIRSLHYVSKRVQDVVTYEAVLEVENPDLLLRPGMTAVADVTTEVVEDVLLAPNESLRFLPPDELKKLAEEEADADLDAPLKPANQGTVWKLVDGRPVSVAVTTGRSDGRWTEILNGDVKPGDVLATDVKPPKP